MEKVWKKLEKSQKIHFSANFHGWILAFPGLKNVPKGQIWHSLCPQWGILMGKLVSTGFWVHWMKKVWKNWEKSQKIHFSGHILGPQGHFQVLKFDPGARFWCSLGLWWGIGICKVVSRCLFGFSRQLEGSKLTSTKIWHFWGEIHKVNEALDGETFCRP